MFQNLSQGAPVYVLYKNIPRVANGKVLSANTHIPTYNPSQPMAMLNGPVTDLSVQVDNETIPFSALPANAILANFADKGVLITEDKSVIVREVEAMAQASRQALEQVPTHEKMIKACEGLLVELQPERQKEAQQAQQIASLESRLAEMNGKFDELVGMLAGRLGNNQKTESQ